MDTPRGHRTTDDLGSARKFWQITRYILWKSLILVLQGCFCYPNGIVCDDCLLKTHSNIQVNLMSSIILLQEIFICLALPPRCSTSLADIWENLHHPPAGIIDGLVCRLYNILVLYLYLWSGFCIITTYTNCNVISPVNWYILFYSFHARYNSECKFWRSIFSFWQLEKNPTSLKTIHLLEFVSVLSLSLFSVMRIISR